MKPKFVRGWMLMGVLALALLAPDWAGAQTSFRRIVVFGTSLSDPGNAFALAGGTNTPPDYDNDPLLVPATPYARGGHHFSNGATWAEQFARSVGSAASANPAFRGSNNGATNYAVGGTRARDVTDSFTLRMQVGAFLQQFGGAAPSDALYVIEMGGNDVRDAIAAYLGAGGGTNGDLAAGAVIADAVAAIGGHMSTLYRSGARKFLVWNVPNLGATPAILGLDRAFPGAAALANGLSQAFNGGLEAGVLAGFDLIPDVRLVRFDVYTKVNDIVRQPAGFGLTEVRKPCITPAIAPFHCQNFDEYLFWDGIHPTAATHGIIAQEVARLLPH